MTFLAILEMAKGKQLRVYQAGPDAPIYVSARTEGDLDPVFVYDAAPLDEMNAPAASEHEEEADEEDEGDDDEEE